MGIIEVRAHLRQFGRDNDIIEFDESSATVALAAKALGTDECRIAKSLSFRATDHAVIVVTAGDMRIDNRKFKDVFKTKAVMPTPQEVEALIGHGVGGVCPFGLRAGVDVYLDVSLRQYDYVYPACGSANSAIKVTCDELARLSGARQWVDVCKGKNSQRRSTSIPSHQPPLLTSRLSQARASFQSRITVCGNTCSAAAVSSTLNPPKNRVSTAWFSPWPHTWKWRIASVSLVDRHALVPMGAAATRAHASRGHACDAFADVSST